MSAAVSLKNAFDEIATAFKKRSPGAEISFNFGASGTLAAQIQNGAPVDVFAPASPQDMDELQNRGCIIADTRTVFAKNAVVFIAPSKSPLPLQAPVDLQRPEVKKIALGNPRTVPAGRYAVEVLTWYRLYEALMDKYVPGENVRQVLDYVARAEVDAGIVYKTDALAQAGEVRIFFQPPEGSHKPVLYPIAVVKNTKQTELARQFVGFAASSEEARLILEKHGFVKP